MPRTDWQSLGIAAAAPLVPRWRALQAQASVMCGPTWSRTVAEAFGLPLELHVWQPGGELAAVVPLLRGDGWRRSWSAAVNDHIPAASFAVGGDTGRLAGELLEQLLRGTDMVVLDRFPLDGALGRALVAAARRRGAPVIEQRAEGGDCFLRLDAPWPEVRGRLSAHNGKENERKRRQLERSGRLEFAAQRTREGLDAVLDDCFALEASGWKGREGLPIARDPQAARFYRTLAHRLAPDGELAIYTLRLDGALIAFEYALRGGARIDVLKIAYDEAHARQSPGGVLRLAIFAEELGAGFRGTYHVGRPSPWKLRWSPEIAALGTLTFYAPTVRGRSFYLGGPVLTGAVRDSETVRRAAGRVLASPLAGRVAAALEGFAPLRPAVSAGRSLLGRLARQ